MLLENVYNMETIKPQLTLSINVGQNSLPSSVHFFTRLLQRCSRSFHIFFFGLLDIIRTLALRANTYSVIQVVMVHSGSQANGLAIQLARAKTGATDVIVFEHSFHGRYLFDILYSA